MIRAKTRLSILTATMVSAAALMTAPWSPAAAQTETTEEELLLQDEATSGEEEPAETSTEAGSSDGTADATSDEPLADEEAAGEEPVAEEEADGKSGAQETADEDLTESDEDAAAAEAEPDQAGTAGETADAPADEDSSMDADAEAEADAETGVADEDEAADDEAQAAEAPPEPEEDVEAPPEVSDEAEENAKELLADDTPAEKLTDEELRERMAAYRALLEEPQLSAETSDALRERLKADRKVLRTRVAETDAAEVEAATLSAAAPEDDESSVDQAVDSITGLFKDDDDDGADGDDDDEGMSNTNKALIAGGLAAAAIALPLLLMPDEEETTRIVTQTQTQPVPVQSLTDAELGQRIMALQQAVDDDTSYTATQRQRFAEELEIAREELRLRLRRDREEREALYREADSYDVPVNYVVPQQDYESAIWAAEVDQDQIWRQLLAAPRGNLPQTQYNRRELSRNIEWIVTRPGVREALPGIELDTITFGFNEDFLREEELYDLDRIARLIEQVVVAHPEEIFLIEGHTDAAGSQEYNWRLSQRRAEAVKDLITEYYLVPPDNLVTAGLGEAYLKIWTPQPEEENRRVTIRRVTPLVAGYTYQ